MNLKYEWINTLFIILPLSLCVFIIVDIAYNERIWELDTFAVKARLQAFGHHCCLLLSFKLYF